MAHAGMLRGPQLQDLLEICLLAFQGANTSPLCRVLPGEACPLTFDIGNEVVSERGVGAGVAVGGAEAAGAQVGQPVHTRRQQLCAARSRGRTRWKQKRRTEINTGAGTPS